MSNVNKVIVALDQMGLEEIDNFLSNKENPFSFVKIGLELYLKHGPDLVHRIYGQYGKKIFLDLKLHDIPVTVAKAISSLKDLPIEFLTVHLSGGEAMLKASVDARNEHIPQCKILGVSFLTSLESRDLGDMFGLSGSEEDFLRLFKIASITQIDGVVSSPLETKLLKRNFPKLLSVTPGIRFQDEIESVNVQDQKRVLTPLEALKMGADYLVIGRSLTKSLKLKERINELQ